MWIKCMLLYILVVSRSVIIIYFNNQLYYEVFVINWYDLNVYRFLFLMSLSLEEEVDFLV